MLRIAAIRLRYRATIPAGTRDKVEALLDRYAAACPAYMTVKDCIDISWTAELTEA